MRIKARVSKVLDLQKGESANGEWKKQSVLVTQTQNAYKDDLMIDLENTKKSSEVTFNNILNLGMEKKNMGKCFVNEKL